MSDYRTRAGKREVCNTGLIKCLDVPHTTKYTCGSFLFSMANTKSK